MSSSVLDLDRLTTLPSENRLYLLNNLAQHLFEAGQTDRLTTLLKSSAWRDARFNQCNETYDNYLQDLDLAWQRANELADKQIEEGQIPSALMDCFRYALIRSSVNSVAGSYVAPLIARAMATGLWTEQRALAVAARCPESGRRAEIYAAILGTGQISSVQVETVQQLMLEAAVIQSQPGAHLNLLVPIDAIIAQLPQQLTMQQVNTVMAIGDEVFKSFILAELFPRLPDVAHADALNVILELSEDEYRFQLIEKILPELPDILLPRIWHFVMEHLPGSRLRERIYALVHGYMAEPPNPWPTALQLLAPRINQTLLQATIYRTLSLNDPWERAMVLVTVFPYLSPEQQDSCGLHALDAIAQLVAEEDLFLQEDLPDKTEYSSLVGSSIEMSTSLIVELPKSGLEKPEYAPGDYIMASGGRPALMTQEWQTKTFIPEDNPLLSNPDLPLKDQEPSFEPPSTNVPSLIMKRIAKPTEKAANFLATLVPYLPDRLIDRVIEIIQSQSIREAYTI